MTNQRYPELTRRSVLTSVGAVGVGAYGFTRFRGTSPSDNDVRYTNYTFAGTEGPRILIGWYSTYNGDLRSGAPTDGDEWRHEATDEYVDDVDAVLGDTPAVDVDNVLPGDSGTLSVGLFVEPDSESTQIGMRLEDDGGALSEAINVQVWYDTGIFGIGGCEGAENGTPTDVITPEGATVADPGELADGIELNPGIFNNGTIDPGDRVCIALAWQLPIGTANSFQQTSGGFDLTFTADNSGSNSFGGV